MKALRFTLLAWIVTALLWPAAADALLADFPLPRAPIAHTATAADHKDCNQECAQHHFQPLTVEDRRAIADTGRAAGRESE